LKPAAATIEGPASRPPARRRGDAAADPVADPVAGPVVVPIVDAARDAPVSASAWRRAPAAGTPPRADAATLPDAGAGMSPLAVHAAALLAVDPLALGGVRLRAAAGPARDAWLAALRARLPEAMPWQRLPLSIGDDRLLGGLDLAASLAARRSVLQRGLLAQSHGGVLVVPMAERLPARTVAALTSVLDRRELVVEREGFGERQPAHLALLALDEALPDDEPLAAALADRLALDVELAREAPGPVPAGGAAAAAPPAAAAAAAAWPDAATLARARALLPEVEVPEAITETLCRASLALGIASARACWWAQQAARVQAALQGRRVVDESDTQLAATLVLAPRATRWPTGEPPDDAAPAPEEPAPEPAENQGASDADPDPAQAPPPDPEAMSERLVAATLAALPPGLLARCVAAANGPRGRTDSEGRSGALAASRRRGAPLGVRPGDPRRGERLSLVDTLRAAIPWQRLRGARADQGVALRMDDLRIVRRAQHRRSTTVFVVDASGSAALHRLAEAKGAVEQLLAESYARRDEVAVIAFRGQRAETLLPPTRSLVRAKRALAGLPGGGGTPIAAALDAADALVEQVQRRGATPSVVLLTDGRANVARDPASGRARAEADALESARRLAARGARAIVIDTSPRPAEAAARLAAAMQARYLPLPHLRAESLSAAVRSLPA